MPPALGTVHEEKHQVLQEDAITFLGSDVTPSLATPAMIRWMEVTCRNAVHSQLGSGQDTVGTKVNVEHLGATPLGAAVSYRAKLTAIDDRRLTFEVEAHDGQETVGRGTHERFVIDIDRFAKGLKKRFAKRQV